MPAYTDEQFIVHLTGRPLLKEDQPLLEHRGYCPLGRETAIQRLEWKDGWPYVSLLKKSKDRMWKKLNGRRTATKKMISDIADSVRRGFLKR